MPFWTYMLHCADRTFYVGHTDDLESRLAQHEQASLGGYTASRLPVKLVWCSEFPSRYEALSAERQIKGWSRAKKLALIREDWDAIGLLAQNMEVKGMASTSSARTGEGTSVRSAESSTPTTTVRPEPVEACPERLPQAGSRRGRSSLLHPRPTRLPLKLHPNCHCPAVTRMEVEVVRLGPVALQLRYILTGNAADLAIPAAAAPHRTDGLWQHTCFEAFLRRPEERAYRELNLSPSTQWAAYRFDGYRSGMEPVEMDPPRVQIQTHSDSLELQATFALPGERPWQLALSAVIEEKNGRKSYWALEHPAAKPDFHHPDSFVHELP